VHFLTGRGSVSVLGGAFHLELYRNFAGPRNILQGHTVLVSLLAIAGVAAIAFASTRVRTTTFAIAVGLALGAGSGNLVDRLFRDPGPLRGGVIDWLRPGWSSGTMNLADIALEAALVLAIIGAAGAWWRSRLPPQPHNSPATQPGGPA
jgi:signal peptidase II